MTVQRPLVVIDTCVGGLSVIRSLRDSGRNEDMHFLADYAVNPLGVKDDDAVAGVVRRWLALAEERSDSLVIACNTLSIRYRQLKESGAVCGRPETIVSMADCFAAMARREADRLAGRRTVILGTAFTASQPLYPDMLRSIVPDARVSTVAATALERSIARLAPGYQEPAASLSDEARTALANAEFAVLGCTCFPVVREGLERRFPDVEFIDPGACCADLLPRDTSTGNRALAIEVTGDVITADRVREFATSYLGDACDVS